MVDDFTGSKDLQRTVALGKENKKKKKKNTGNNWMIIYIRI
jgi:hypothetical protein